MEELAKIFDGESAEVAHLDLRDVEKDIQLENEQVHNEKDGVMHVDSKV